MWNYANARCKDTTALKAEAQPKFQKEKVQVVKAVLSAVCVSQVSLV